MAVVLMVVLVGVLVICMSAFGDHIDIKKKGGIRTKYNKLFSYFYNLPNSRIKLENKSFVMFIIDDLRCEKVVKMHYFSGSLTVTCVVRYHDDTAFDNGKKFQWTVDDKDGSEDKALTEIQSTMATLP